MTARRGDAVAIGVDIGTSSCKGILLTAEGVPLAVARADYGVDRPRPGWAEQDVKGYWNATRDVLQQLSEHARKERLSIEGVGVVGQTPTEVFVDDRGQPLRPAIIWQDRRAVDEARIMEEAYGDGRLREVLGIHMPITESWSPTRLLWLSRNEPEVARRVHKVLQPKDYVNFRLTGEYVSDSWSSKSLAHVENHSVDEEYLKFLGYEPGIVPEQYEPAEVIGYVHRRAAAETGLPEGTAVVTGWTDALSAMLATGAFAAPGRAFNCTGTSEIVGITTISAGSMPGVFTVPRCAIGPVSTVYGPTQNGGSSLLWARDVYALPEEESEAWMARLVDVPPGCDGLIFLPYLDGERAPVWNARARGVFVGATSATTRDHFGRAVLEGVAFSVRHVLEVAMQAAQGCLDGQNGLSVAVMPRAIRLVGGGSRHDLWCQIRADVTGLPVETLETDEGSAVGAAILAAVGAGLHRDIASASLAMVKVKGSFEPRTGVRQLYDDLFGVYKSIYERLADLFPALEQATARLP